jgi:hypothetical protein
VAGISCASPAAPARDTACGTERALAPDESREQPSVEALRRRRHDAMQRRVGLTGDRGAARPTSGTPTNTPPTGIITERFANWRRRISSSEGRGERGELVLVGLELIEDGLSACDGPRSMLATTPRCSDSSSAIRFTLALCRVPSSDRGDTSRRGLRRSARAARRRAHSIEVTSSRSSSVIRPTALSVRASSWRSSAPTVPRMTMSTEVVRPYLNVMDQPALQSFPSLGDLSCSTSASRSSARPIRSSVSASSASASARCPARPGPDRRGCDAASSSRCRAGDRSPRSRRRSRRTVPRGSGGRARPCRAPAACVRCPLRPAMGLRQAPRAG